MEINLFEKIKNGEITSTDPFQVKVIRRGTDDSDKYDTYISLLDMISEKYIEGIEDTKGNLGPNYKNLKVTKEGLKVYKFWMTPIDQIGKPTYWEVMKNGIIGTFVGRFIWWLVATGIFILIPTFNEDARNMLKEAISSLSILLSHMR